MKPRDPQPRLAALSIPEPNTGCRLWLGSIDSKGYGRISLNNYPRQAHRVAYEVHVGPIPAGLQLDHFLANGPRPRCIGPSCIEPSHLRPATNRENQLRGNGAGGVNSRKTHCIRGHELAGANLLSVKRGGQVCRICNRILSKAGKARMNARRRTA